jgi:transposase-like protein
MTREQKIAKARELREQGLSYPTLAGTLGVGVATVYRWLNEAYAEHDRAAARNWKRTHKGTCADCGAPTDASNGFVTSSRCADCAGVAPKGIDGDEVVRLYCDELLSCYAIAARFEIAESGVQKHLKRRGVRLRSPREAAQLRRHRERELAAAA